MPSPLNFVRLMIISFSLTCALPSVAAEINKDDLDAQKELLQLRIDSGRELLQKDIEAQWKRLDAIDKRIDDQVNRVSDIGNAVDRFTAISGWISILITVLLASGGLVGYFSVVAKAKREAKETASNWFAENEKELRAKIDSLHSHARDNINHSVQSVQDSATEAQAVIERTQKTIGLMQSDTSPNPDNDKDTKTLLRRTDELKDIPENNYSFDDWNTRAFAAYKAGKLEEATLYWEKATKVPTASLVNSAQAIFNQAFTLGQMGKTEEEIVLYDQLIDTYADDNTPALREQVAKAMGNKAVLLGEMEKNEEAIALCDQLIATYADDKTPALRNLVAQARFNKAVTLGKMEKNEEEIALYDQLIATYADDKTPALRNLVAQAMSNKAVTLGKMEKNEEAIALYNQLIATYADDKTPALRNLVAQAMFNKAVTLGKMEKNEEEIALYDQLIATYADDKTPALRELVAKAISNKAVTLGKMEKNEEAIALYDQLIATYADDKTPALREQVAQAMFNKTVRLRKMEKKEEEIALYDQLIATYADDKTPALRELVAKAMSNKAVTLGKMEKNEEAIALYDQLIATYADDKTPALRELVAKTMNGKGFSHLLLAKKNWTNRDLALDYLTWAKESLQGCLKRKPQWGMALGNLAYVQWLLGKPQAVEQAFHNALAAGENGGEMLYKGTLDDIAQHSIPEDIGFRELVDRLWAEYQGNRPSNT
ncbi:tetratricopeptide repeat protein [Azonexus sp.]|uniref:tetratricopeptide repeat protein n=1 Tax=Azonexus sp. TaxID=1872668 RepID=UPI0027BA5BA1|nr:hypothetical protein [Azonexus sp.]